MSPQTLISNYKKMQRHYAVKARRERFMRCDSDAADYYAHKAMMAHTMIQIALDEAVAA